MANERVYGCKVSNQGVRMVELMGGWVPFDALRQPRRVAIGTELIKRLDPADWDKWESSQPMNVSLVDQFYEAPPRDDQNPGDGAKQDEQIGGGDDQFQGETPESESEAGDDESEAEQEDESEAEVPPPPSGGKGDGDDEPVMHSEFDPWADQVGKAIKGIQKQNADLDSKVQRVEAAAAQLEARMDDARADINLAVEAAAAVQRKVDFVDKAVKELRLSGGGSKGGGVIVQIEVTKPDLSKLQLDGLFHNQFPKLLKLVAGGHHVYLPGPPGSGKSHAAFQVATALGWRFGSISLGPTTPESRLMGGMDANGNFHSPAFVEGLIYAEENPDSGFVFCEDELDNGHPGIIATQNSVMANGFITLPNGRTVQVGKNWVVVASANTYGTGPTAEFSGRNRLDAATLDRFRYLPWDTDKGMESAMVRGILHDKLELADDWIDAWESARKNCESHGLKVFITMRGALAGATMLAQGFDIFDAMDIVLLNKLPQDQAKKINPL